jgi:hypothetical protein
MVASGGTQPLQPRRSFQEANMDPVVAAFSVLIGLNDRLVGRALDGLSDEEAWRHPGTDPNPTYWIAAHVTAARNALASAVGVGLDLPWAGRFDMKTQPDPAAGGPPLADIRAAFTTLGERLTGRFATLSEAELAEASPRAFPTPDKTVRGTIGFLTFHETYHVGQLAYLRKWLGYPGIVDGQ